MTYYKCGKLGKSITLEKIIMCISIRDRKDIIPPQPVGGWGGVEEPWGGQTEEADRGVECAQGVHASLSNAFPRHPTNTIYIPAVTSN